MQPHSTEQGSRGPDLFDASPAGSSAPLTDPHAPSFGTRLRAAREARGLDLATCAHALKLSISVIRQLECDAYDSIDSKIYLASYIGKYGHYLGINESSVQVELDRIKNMVQVEPPLIATGGISHSRFLLDRYATAATYVVLTAVIVVPMVWLGVRGTLDRNLAHLAPLDASPVVQLDAPALTSSEAATLQLPRVAPPEVHDQPLLASMAPFPGLENSPVPAPARVVSGTHNLTLSLSAASWVEVTDQAGERLEYGLLPAGSDKSYHSDQPLDVRIGNASGAKISVNGEAVGLEDFRRANVAHFRVRMQDGKVTAGSL